MPMPKPKPAGAAGPYTGTNPAGNEEEKMTNAEKGQVMPKNMAHMSNEAKYKAGLLNKQVATPQKEIKQSPVQQKGDQSKSGQGKTESEEDQSPGLFGSRQESRFNFAQSDEQEKKEVPAATGGFKFGFGASLPDCDDEEEEDGEFNMPSSLQDLIKSSIRPGGQTGASQTTMSSQKSHDQQYDEQANGPEEHKQSKDGNPFSKFGGKGQQQYQKNAK